MRLAGRAVSSSSLRVRSMTCEAGRFVLTEPLGTEADPSREAVVTGEGTVGVASTLSFDNLLPETSMISSRPSFPSSLSVSGMGVLDDSAATDQAPSTSIVTESTVLGVLFKISRKYLNSQS